MDTENKLRDKGWGRDKWEIGIYIHTYIYIYTHTHIHTHTHTVESFSGLRKKEVLPFATTWMSLEVIMSLEIS